MKAIWITIALGAALLAAGCATKGQIEKALADDPDMIFNALNKNPDKFLAALNQVSVKAQEKQALEESKKREEEYASPRNPAISASRAIRGQFGAPITVVEYSDFQCPYCKMGAKVVDELRAKYGSRLRVVFKNLPLEFHEMAMPAAKYFEAIAMQSPAKAYAYHDEIFAHQDKLMADKEKFLMAAAKKAGANMTRLKKDLDSDEVKQHIAADMEEARSFGINGTPGFIVQGITLGGVAPLHVFDEIIDKREKEIASGHAPTPGRDVTSTNDDKK